MLTSIKKRASSFLTWHCVNPLLRQSREVIYQQLVHRDLRRAGVDDDLYPVGAAAGYGLLYLLIRILRENPIRKIVELGSGESTRLIDRLKPKDASHICYEEDASWHAATKPRLTSCDYRLRHLTRYRIGGVDCEWYGDVESTDFDLLLVDGPVGVPRYSRIGCWKLIEANPKRDFVIVMDDTVREGEAETARFIAEHLQRQGLRVFSHRLDSGNAPTVICAGALSQVRFYF